MYTFVNRHPESSVYDAVAKELLESGDWKCTNPDSLRFNLMLGDRNGLPFERFGE